MGIPKIERHASIKAIRNARVCFECAMPILDDGAIMCPRCDSGDISERQTKPKPMPAREVLKLPHPWGGIRLKQGATLLLSGDKGSGKTTICLKLKPTRISSSEQEPEEVAATFYRIHGTEAEPPVISSCYSWEHLEEDLLGIGKDDLVVVDSISQLAMHHHTGEICRGVIEHVRRSKARAIFIAQFTKGGEMLGPNELSHLVDVVCKIPNDSTGMRRILIEKDRNGASLGSYFTLGARGPEKLDFEYAYSVEGGAGQYRLHLYPFPGAKLSGPLDLLTDQGVPIAGCATAGVVCTAYAHGIAQLPDHLNRKRFSEDHGLTWLSPPDIQNLIDEAKVDQEPL